MTPHKTEFTLPALLFLILQFFSILADAAPSRTIIEASNLSYSNGRYVQTQNGAIEFDWAGLRISTRFSFSQNFSETTNRLETLIHLKDPGNYYTVSLYRMNGNVRSQLVQQAVLATEKDVDQPYSLLFTWNIDRSAVITALEFEIEKRTEAMIGVVTFRGFTFIHNNAISILPSKTSQEDDFKIEFLGDSISCGYGNLGKPPCAYSPSTQNVHESFVEKTSRILNASEIHVECWSGKGVVRNYGDKNTTSKDPFPVYYPRSVANDPNILWDFRKTFVPDMVVVTLGTNDFSTAPRPSFDEFNAGYQNLIDFIFSKYYPIKGPSLKLVLVVSSFANTHDDAFSECSHCT